jgi:hypothetical protein
VGTNSSNLFVSTCFISLLYYGASLSKYCRALNLHATPSSNDSVKFPNACRQFKNEHLSCFHQFSQNGELVKRPYITQLLASRTAIHQLGLSEEGGKWNCEYVSLVLPSAIPQSASVILLSETMSVALSNIERPLRSESLGYVYVSEVAESLAKRSPVKALFMILTNVLLILSSVVSQQSNTSPPISHTAHLQARGCVRPGRVKGCFVLHDIKRHRYYDLSFQPASPPTPYTHIWFEGIGYPHDAHCSQGRPVHVVAWKPLPGKCAKPARPTTKEQ